MLIQSLPQNATEQVQQPFWSPDSRYIGFFADGKLKKIDIASGNVQTLCSLPGNNYGGTWNRDGTILLGTALTKGLQRVSAEGGTPSQVTAIDLTRKEMFHLWPQFLPDGRHYLYLATTASGERSVYVASIDSDDRKLLLNSTYMANFSPPDSLFFIREAALMVQRFDLRTLALTGEPTQIAERVQNAGNGRPGFTVSETGVLIYRPALGAVDADSRLEWFDRTGKSLGTIGAVSAYRGVELSPDGFSAVVHRESGQSAGDIFVLDLQRASESRFTFDPAQHNVSPVWTPDGRHIIFGRSRGNSWAIYEKDSTGVGDERLLHQVESSGIGSLSFVVPRSVLPDGEGLLFSLRNASTLSDLWVLRFAGEPKATPYIESQFNEEYGQLRPDGRWVAWASSGTGSGGNQVWVQDFPSAGTRFQVSTAEGGTQPRWRADGRELFYLAPPGSALGQGRLMSVTVESAGGTLKFGIPPPPVRFKRDDGGPRITCAASAELFGLGRWPAVPGGTPNHTGGFECRRSPPDCRRELARRRGDALKPENLRRAGASVHR